MSQKSSPPKSRRNSRSQPSSCHDVEGAEPQVNESPRRTLDEIQRLAEEELKSYEKILSNAGSRGSTRSNARPASVHDERRSYHSPPRSPVPSHVDNPQQARSRLQSPECASPQQTRSKCSPSECPSYQQSRSRQPSPEYVSSQQARSRLQSPECASPQQTRSKCSPSECPSFQQSRSRQPSPEYVSSQQARSRHQSPECASPQQTRSEFPKSLCASPQRSSCCPVMGTQEYGPASREGCLSESIHPSLNLGSSKESGRGAGSNAYSATFEAGQNSSNKVCVLSGSESSRRYLQSNSSAAGVVRRGSYMTGCGQTVDFEEVPAPAPAPTSGVGTGGSGLCSAYAAASQSLANTYPLPSGFGENKRYLSMRDHPHSFQHHHYQHHGGPEDLPPHSDERAMAALGHLSQLRKTPSYYQCGLTQSTEFLNVCCPKVKDAGRSRGKIVRLPEIPCLERNDIDELIKCEAQDVESAFYLTSDERKPYKKPCPKQQKAQMTVKSLMQSHANPICPQQKYTPLEHPDPEDISPELAAVMMFSQEQGIKMEGCPTDIINRLYPEEPKWSFPEKIPQSNISVIDPNQKEQMIQKSASVPSEGATDSAYTKTMREKGDEMGSQRSYDVDFVIGQSKREYVLVAEKPQRINKIQFRGGNTPPWFPGYFSAFPDDEEGIKLVSSPSELFHKAWVHSNPGNLPNSDVIVLD